MDGAFGIVQEGVEVEGFLAIGDVEHQRLAAVDTAQTGGGIESARAAGVIEAHLGHTGRIVVGEDETAKGDDALGGDIQLLAFVGNGYVFTIQEGISKTMGIGELNFTGVGHGGVAVAAMGYNDQEVGAWGELETRGTGRRGRAPEGGELETRRTRKGSRVPEGGELETRRTGKGDLLVDLLDAGAILVVDSKVETGRGQTISRNPDYEVIVRTDRLIRIRIIV